MFIDARLYCFLLASLLCAAAASAQQPTPQTQADGGRIYLDVVVAPESGRPVAGLQQQDFTLLDNKARQTITSFAAVSDREAPVEVIVVLDAVNTTFQYVGSGRIGIDKFLRADDGHLKYPVAVEVLKNTGLQLVGNFSSDGTALASALQQDDAGLRVDGRSTGFSGETERWKLSLDALDKLVANLAARPGRKIILWVSPGWPLLSGQQARTDIDSKDQQKIFTEIVRLSTQFLRARVTLYGLDPLGSSEPIAAASYYKQFLNGISKPSQVYPGDLGLQVLAVQSGGFMSNFSNDIAGLLQESIAESAPYYEISFDPGAAAKPNEYHHLEIKLAKPGLTARTRQGYYAQPSASN